MLKNTTKFKIPKFDRKDFAIWKVKMHAIMIKDVCAVAVKSKSYKPTCMIDMQKVYEDKYFLRKKLYNLKIKNGAYIHKHLNEFNFLLNELLGIGMKLDGEK